MSTINSAKTTTVTLSTSGAYQSPLTIASDGSVDAAGIAIDGPNTQAWTVANYGTVTATGNGSIGVYLGDGGSVANGGTSALISGNGAAIKISGAAGTVTNYGTIEGTGTGIGVEFSGGFDDTLTNSGTIAGAGGQDAVLFGSGNDTLIVDPGAVFTGTVDGGGGGNTIELTSAATTGTLSGIGTSFVNWGAVIVDSGASWVISGSAIAPVKDAGAYLENTGTVTGVGSHGENSAAILMTGTNGVLINTSTGNINSSRYGIYAYANGESINNSGYVGSGFLAIVTGHLTYNVTVVNTGTVIAVDAGVQLEQSGTVINSGSTSLIESTGHGAGAKGVSGTYSPITIINAGTIEGGYGVYLGAGGGAVTNQATGTITAFADGVGVYAFDPATVDNAGYITGGTGGTAINLHFGGLVIDRPGAVFYGNVLGGGGTLELASAANPGTITGLGTSFQNFGTITVDSNAKWVLQGTNTAGITLSTGADLDVTGTISVAGTAVYGTGGASSVVNSGTISGTGAAGIGVYLSSGGDITSTGTGALISGSVYGAYVKGRFDTVSNAGTITATGGVGVKFGNYGHDTLINSGTIAGASGQDAVLFAGYDSTVLVYPSAVFTGTVEGGAGNNILEFGSAASAGTITLDGTTATGFGTTFVNFGTLEVAAGASLVLTGYDTLPITLNSGAYLDNQGTIDSGETAVLGYTGGAATVVNTGTIESTGGFGVGFGVKLEDGGSVTNSGTGALISSDYDGIVVQNAAGTVSNTGTISVTGDKRGVWLEDGGSVANTGTAAAISGGTGILIASALGTVSNSGTITATASEGVGVYLEDGGSLSNTGLIDSDYVGVKIGGSNDSTITNAGTISGGETYHYAVKFGGGDDRLIIDPSAVFVGFVDGNIGTNTIELASATGIGTISGIGQEYRNFSTITVDAGAQWVLAGNVSGETIIDSGSLTTTGSLGSEITLTGAGAYLDNTGTIDVTTPLAVYSTATSTARVTNTGTIESTSDVAVSLTDGGSVANTSTAALIEGSNWGVAIAGYEGTVSNTGTIIGGGRFGVYVNSPHTGDSIANTGTAALIEGVSYGAFLIGIYGALSNSGSIAATGAGGIGVYLYGTVTNAGTISGAGDAVKLAGGDEDRLIVDPGAVFIGDVVGGVVGGGGRYALELASSANTGTLSGLGTKYLAFNTITIDSGAKWVLAGNNTIASGVTLTALGSVDNTGTLTGSGGLVVDPATMTNSGSIGVAVTLDAGSYLDNTGTGTISVSGNAVVGSGGAVSVVNAGTITGTGANGVAVYLGDGGSVSNSGTAALLSGYAEGIKAENAAPATVTNTGTIESTGASGIGVYLADGGYVGNSGTASYISGASDAVYVKGAAGTVSNAGTIASTAGNGVYLDAGGSVSNSGLISDYASNPYVAGINVAGAAGTVTNTGTIKGGHGEYHFGVYLQHGGVVTNSGTAARISSVNEYAIKAKGAAGTVVNAGTITTGEWAVSLSDGGSVANNGTAALISAGIYTVLITNAAGTVTNTGTIRSTIGVDVDLANGGSINNGATGLISGPSAAIFMPSSRGTITNAGTITGTTAEAIYVGDGGSVANTGSAALISGAGGVYIKNAGGTVTNAGTISGGADDAVKFVGNFTDRVIVDPGAVFDGDVVGGSGSNTLELASAAGTGTITGLGTKYQNFGTITVDAGAQWVVSGDDTTALVTIDSGGYLDNTGTITVAGTAVYGTGGTVSVTNAGTIDGTGSSSVGIYLKDGGGVANTGTAGLIEGYNAILVHGAAGTVANAGAIAGIGVHANGVDLADGGSVSNAATGTISGFNAIIISGAPGTVTNSGSLTAGSDGIYLQDSGSVSNSGTAAIITGFNGIVSRFSAGTTTVTNTGTVIGTSGTGIYLGQGGSVGNTSTAALVEGAVNGIQILGGAGRVTNAGTIEATGGSGVGVDFSGDFSDTLTNSGTIAGASGHDAVLFGSGADRLIVDPGAVFTGTVDGGAGSNTIELASAATTGTLSGIGTSLVNFGAVSVDAGASWVISGNAITSVSDAGAYLKNTGTVTGVGGSGPTSSGILMTGVDGSLVNTGSISGFYGVSAYANGEYINNSARISSGFIAIVSGKSTYDVTVVNSGTLSGADGGVGFERTGIVINSGTASLIEDTNGGIADGVSGNYRPITVVNAGTIQGGYGVYLPNGGGVTNQSTGTIASTTGQVGVQADVSATVDNAGTISGGTGGVAVKLMGGGLMIDRPGAVFIDDVEGGGGKLELASAASIGTLTGLGTSFVNFGTVVVDAGARWVLAGSNSLASGVTLTEDGNSTNSGSLTGAGSLVIDPASMTNTGYIGIATTLDAGSYLDNTSTGTISVAGTAVTGTGGAVTIANAGTISGRTGGVAINLHDGGRVIDHPGAVFVDNVYGGGGTLELASAAGTGTISGVGTSFVNFSAIVVDPGASWVVSGSNVAPIRIGAGGYVDNAGTLTSSGGSEYIGPVAVYGTGSAVTVVNTGTIGLGGSPETGIYLKQGGSVANTGTAAYIAAYSAGIRIDGGAGIVTNSGTITGSGNFFGANQEYAAVELFDGGSVNNSGVIGGGGRSIYITGGTGTVTNTGTTGYIQLGAGGYVDNTGTGAQIDGNIYFGYGFSGTQGVDGTVSNGGTISGYIHLKSGSIANTGTAALISGNIGFYASGTVSNAGTIDASMFGIRMGAGGSVANTGTAALISGQILFITGAGTVSNAGTIEGGGDAASGIELSDGGSIGNTGTASLIRGFDGIFLQSGTNTVTNAGTISGASYAEGGAIAGIIMYRPGTSLIVNNETGALISAPGYGIYGFLGAAGKITNDGTITGGSNDGIDLVDGGASTVINAGTISGGSGHDAVAFGSGNDRLVIDPGAVFVGDVDGGSGSNTLELASSTSIGTLTGLGTSFVNFGTLTVDTGAHWVIDGANTIASGDTLTNDGSLTGTGSLIFDPSTLVNPGYIGVAVTLSGAGGYLDNESTGTITVAGTAVYGTGGAVTVVNAGTIEGTGSPAAGVYLDAGGSVANTGSAALISGDTGIVIANATGTVTNAGTIEGSTGVHLGAGGSVSNNGTGALITGVEIYGAAGTVSNAGTIDVVGVRLEAGGSVINSGTASLIECYDSGVSIYGARGTVTNYGTITTNYGPNYHIRENGVWLYDGGSVANMGTASLIVAGGGQGGVVVWGAAGTITNYGTISEDSPDGGYGVYLKAGGTVANNGMSALISGPEGGVLVNYAAGTVTNSGTITGGSGFFYPPASRGAGIALLDGGAVGNTGTASLIYGYSGIVVEGAAGTVTNTGTIESAAHYGRYLSAGGNFVDGIYLGAGGSVGNTGTAALISGARTGVWVTGAVGTVTNAGTIKGAAHYGVYLGDGGSVANTGTASLISGHVAGIRIAGAVGTVANYHAITASSGVGVYLVAGGTITNGSGTATGASIAGYMGGVRVGNDSSTTTATVTNYGTIEATGSTSGYGVEFYSSGIVINGSTSDTSAVITGYTDGLELGLNGMTPPSTVTNFGTIEATGTAGGDGISLGDGGNVTNGSALLSTGATVRGSRYGIDSTYGGTVANYGTIQGGQAGVAISGATGALINGGTAFTTAVITGSRGVYLSTGTLTNFGLIEGSPSGTSALGTYFGVDIAAGGSIGNHGTIEGLGAAGTVAYGVTLTAGGVVTNGTSALISGYSYGIAVGGSGYAGTVTNLGTIEATGTAGVGVSFNNAFSNTLTNAGTIIGASGHDAVLFGGGDNLLVVHPGAVFTGAVDGGSADDSTIELTSAAATGTLSGLGTSVVNFAYITVDAGAKWVISGSEAGTVTLDSGSYLKNTGTISVVSGAAVYGVGGAVSLVNTGTITGTLDLGVYLSDGGSVTNGSTVANTGSAARIYGGTDGILARNAAVTITNYGTIIGAGTSFSNAAIYLGDGGSVANSGTASLISGGNYGVNVVNAAGTVTNAGTIAGTAGYGVLLNAGGSVTNTGTVSRISGGVDGIKVLGAAATVSNAGTITGGYGAGLGINGAGVYLSAGGSVANTGTAAMISGDIGVEIDGAVGTVTNAGAIHGFVAIYLGDGGTITNSGTGALISAAYYGIASEGAATVINAGTITGTSSLDMYVGDGGSTGIGLDDGGKVTNGSTVANTGSAAQIYGGGDGILAKNAAATITNYGTITGACAYFLDAAIYLGDGGSIANIGTASQILGGIDGIKVLAAAGTVSNAGTIEGSAGIGIYLGDGGTVTNGSTVANTGSAAQIYGGKDGIFVTDAVATITNYGTIISAGTSVSDVAIYLGDGGTVINSGTASLIAGANYGIAILNAAGTVTNAGTIEGTVGGGVYLGAGGSVSNNGTGALISGYTGVNLHGAAGTVTNYGTIEGFAGIYLEDGGTVINSGTASLISGYGDGISIYGVAGTVTNYGTIESLDEGGVALYHGGSVANMGTAATISGGGGVGILGGVGTVTNSGTIIGYGGEGVYLRDGGSIANTGTAALISGYENGIVVKGAAGTVNNAGTIISAHGDGIKFLGSYNDTLTNYGTIAGHTGHDAVLFGGGNDRLIVDPGAVFSGNVVGGSGTNTLELASAANIGTISNIGTKYLNFGSIAVDPGASWDFAAGDTIANGGTLEIGASATVTGTVAFGGASGEIKIDGTVMPSITISGIAVGDTIDLAAIAYASGANAQLVDGVLEVSENGHTYDLTLAAIGSNVAFHLTTDNGTGTDITAINGPQVTTSNAANFTQGAGAVRLSPTVTLTDAASTTLTGATVVLSGGTFAGDGDVLAATGTGNISVSYNSTTETLTLSGTDTLSDYEQVLGTVTFNNTSQNPTDYGSDLSRTATWTINDGSYTGSTTETVSITPVHVAPSLSGVPSTASFTPNGGAISLSPTFSAIMLSDPDSMTISSATVSITGGTFSGDGDVLATNTTGLAITASYNSTTETLTLSGTDTLADYRAALSFVTFNSTSSNPTNSEANPTRTISWQVNDGASSNNLSNVATTTVSINPPPFEIADSPLTLGQGTTATIGLSMLRYGDTDTSPSGITYTVTSGPSDGTLLLNGSPTTSFTGAEINSGEVSYHETAGNVSSDSFAFTVSDPFGNTTSTQTFQIGISQGTPPFALANSPLSLTAGTTATITSSLLRFGSSVGPQQETYTVTTAPADGTLLKNGSATTSFTQADVNNGLISYHETVANTVSDSFSFVVSDGLGNATAPLSFQIQIAPTTPPFALVNSPLSLTQGTTSAIGSTLLRFGDTNSGPQQETYTIVSAPADGTLLLSGSATSSFTQAEINNGLVSYQETAPGVTSDAFSFTVTDPYGNATPTETFNIGITSTVAPFAIANSPLSLTQGATATIGPNLLRFGDVASTAAQVLYTLTTGPQDGMLLLNGVRTDSFTGAEVNANELTYKETTNGATSDSFSFTVSDPYGNTTATQTFSFQITSTVPPFEINNNPLTIAVGATSEITHSLLAYGDVASDPQQEIFTVTGAPADGTLLLNGSATSSFTEADINNGLVSYHETANGASSDSFAFTVSDPYGNTTATQHFQINI